MVASVEALIIYLLGITTGFYLFKLAYKKELSGQKMSHEINIRLTSNVKQVIKDLEDATKAMQELKEQAGI